MCLKSQKWQQHMPHGLYDLQKMSNKIFFGTNLWQNLFREGTHTGKKEKKSWFTPYTVIHLLSYDHSMGCSRRKTFPTPAIASCAEVWPNVLLFPNTVGHQHAASEGNGVVLQGDAASSRSRSAIGVARGHSYHYDRRLLFNRSCGCQWLPAGRPPPEATIGWLTQLGSPDPRRVTQGRRRRGSRNSPHWPWDGAPGWS